MLVVQSVAGQKIAIWAPTTTPDGYFLQKSSGSLASGAGTVDSSTPHVAVITLDATDVDTLGPVSVIVTASGIAIGYFWIGTVVESLPLGTADARLNHLDADVSSRTKPADTQAAVTSVANVAGDVVGRVLGSGGHAFVADGVQVASSGSVVQLDAVQPFYAPAKAGDSMALTNPERDAVAAALLGYSNGVDVGVSVAHALMIMCAILAGKTSRAGDSTFFRNWQDTKDRAVIKSNVSGRYQVTFDFT